MCQPQMPTHPLLVAPTDSRSIDKNQLFVALRGPNFDGHEFVGAAETRGASAVMVDHHRSATPPALLVEDTRVSLGRLAGVWRDRFSLPIAAVTGSNGKTTVKEMLASILAVEGQSSRPRGISTTTSRAAHLDADWGREPLRGGRARRQPCW